MTDKAIPFPIPHAGDVKTMLGAVAAQDPELAIVIFQEEGGETKVVFRTKDGSDRDIGYTLGLMQLAALSLWSDA